MSSKKVLGRGLSAIIEDVEEAYKQDIEQAKDLVREIDIERIKPRDIVCFDLFDDTEYQFSG